MSSSPPRWPATCNVPVAGLPDENKSRSIRVIDSTPEPPLGWLQVTKRPTPRKVNRAPPSSPLWAECTNTAPLAEGVFADTAAAAGPAPTMLRAAAAVPAANNTPLTRRIAQPPASLGHHGCPLATLNPSYRNEQQQALRRSATTDAQPPQLRATARSLAMGDAGLEPDPASWPELVLAC